ncbi:hypothetical protein DFJ63DRAFT_97911 [Scheffersomyces coipomensis]|uniref:uncharacterized protein n=1 Tax=Scheffersomyces coipomensis TaxID=1788519 RepID=UPI00315C878F
MMTDQLQFQFQLQNSNIVELLPSILHNLFYKQTKLDNFTRYLQSKYDFESQYLLTKLKDVNESSYNQLNDNDNNNNTLVKLDNDKTLLLGYLFGNVFIDAMNIVNEDSSIEIKILKRGNDINSNDIVEQFMKDQHFNHPLFFYVNQLSSPNSTISSKSQKLAQSLREELLELEYKQYLHDLEIDRFGSEEIEQKNIMRQSQINQELKSIYSSNTNQNHSNNDQTDDKHINQSNMFNPDKNYVDLKNWYCDCQQYQQCYNNDGQIITSTKLIAKFNSSDQSNPIINVLRQIPSHLLDPLPMCSHLLSVLILITNYNHLKHKSSINNSSTCL